MLHKFIKQNIVIHFIKCLGHVQECQIKCGFTIYIIVSNTAGLYMYCKKRNTNDFTFTFTIFVFEYIRASSKRNVTCGQPVA